MKKLLLTFVVLLAVSLTAVAQSFFSDADAFLKDNVKNGLVNYEQMVVNPSALNGLVETIGTFTLSNTDQNTQLAFYLNTYNILAIKNVVDNYPLASPLDIDGFFDKKSFEVSGKNLTLNQIENDIIRPQFKDARIHFALVCVAKGCPQLSNTAFTPQNVDAYLEQLTMEALNNPNFIKYESNTVLASEIFKWYIVDFGNSNASILDYIGKYAKKDITGFSLDFYPYNWELNGIK